MRFGKKCKLSSRYIGPFPIVLWIRAVAYKLDLPPKLENIHLVFHVFMLKKYILDPSHVLPEIMMALDNHLSYEECPIAVVDH